MATFAARLSVSLCLVSCVLASFPHPPIPDSELTILTHNDLYGNTSHRQASVIVVGQRQSLPAATAACAALGESLWSHTQHAQELDFLQYLGYNNKKHTQQHLYWVASNAHARCNAISAQGRTQQLPCDTPLPALCQNSAVASSLELTDTSSRWQTAVSTGNATITGYRDKHSFRFHGIKYATVPTRFLDSSYLPPTGNISALSYGPDCIQGSCSSGAVSCSEECLYLNIWTPFLPTSKGPKKTKEKKKAVMVWIHGGGFVSGSGSDTTFDGGAIASRGDVVLVTINYRLGNFGFLALNGTSLTGNYGLKDQSTALDWLHAHVGAFGGDKDRITVFGQSAGAASVRALLASPTARHKFANAITQSTPQGLNYASTFPRYLSIAEAANRTSSLLNEIGCALSNADAVVDCLRAVNPLNLTTGTVASYPVVDNTFLTTPSLALGHSAPKLNTALLTGIMHDDGSPFTSYPTTTNLTTVLAAQNLPLSLPPTLFPLPTTPANTTLTIFNLTSRIATDAMFRCLDQSTAHTAAKNNIFTHHTYAYEFARALQLRSWSPNPPACEAPSSPSHPNGDPAAPHYKCHSGDLYFVFGTLVREGARVRDDDDIAFAQFVLDSWTAFARTRRPVSEGAFLKARGFANTTAMVGKAGEWRPVGMGRSGAELRVLDVESWSRGWREVEQCEALGLGLGYYDV